MTKRYFNTEYLTNPYAVYSRMREAGRVLWSDEFFGDAWLITHYDDVVNALRDARLSSRRSHVFVGQLAPEIQRKFAEFNRIFAMWMLFLDNPDHRRIRKLMNKGFARQILQDLRPQIQQLVDELLDKVEAVGQMDVMRDLAHPLPAQVITRMLGIDNADESWFISHSDSIAQFFGSPEGTEDMARQAQTSMLALTEYFHTILPERRQRLEDDLISLLIRAEEDGDVLTPEELVAQCSLLLFAGHETTRHLIGNGMLALLQHRDQLQEVKDASYLMGSAVMELLRFESPVQFVIRLALEDFELHGQPIRQSDKVILFTGSANRDPNRFSNPDSLDISRDEGNNLGFGYGAHVCIGGPLALQETEIALTTVLKRMTNMKLIDEAPDWSSDFGFRGLNTLPISFSIAQ